MNQKLCLIDLFYILQTVGHHQLWMEEDNDPGAPLYRAIYTWDDRDVAWWDEQGSSWFLNQEVDFVIENQRGTIPLTRVLLSKEYCFAISLMVNI